MVKLIWDSQYDADSKCTVPPRLKLPFQTVETVNERAKFTEWENFYSIILQILLSR